MKRRLLSLLSLFVLCTAFQSGSTFNKNGVKFTIPAGWAISEEEAIDDGYYLACEKSGSDESGLVTMAWSKADKDPEEVVMAYSNSLTENYSAKDVEVTFGQTAPATYGAFKGKRRNYTFTLMNTPHRGTIYALKGCHQSISLLCQEATEDIAKNKAGFALISSSLGCGK